MKTLIILLACIACLVGCDAPDREESSEEITKPNNAYSVVEVDSCEYVVFDAGLLDQRVFAMTHKGNCKYCRERNKYHPPRLTINDSDVLLGGAGMVSTKITGTPTYSLALDSSGNVIDTPKSFNRNWTEASNATRDTMVITTSTGYYSLAVDSLGNVIDTPRKDGVIGKATTGQEIRGWNYVVDTLKRKIKFQHF